MTKYQDHIVYRLKENEDAEYSEKKIEVIAEEIFGIVYYIDNENNVYKTEDILEGKKNPEIVRIRFINPNRISL